MKRPSLILRVSSQNGISQILLHRRLLFLISKHVNGTQSINYILRLSKVNLIESITNLILHVFNHSTDVGDVRRGFTNRAILFNLKYGLK